MELLLEPRQELALKQRQELALKQRQEPLQEFVFELQRAVDPSNTPVVQFESLKVFERWVAVKIVIDF